MQLWRENTLTDRSRSQDCEEDDDSERSESGEPEQADLTRWS